MGINKKNTKQMLFEMMEKLNPDFNSDNKPVLVKGSDLTDEQRSKLKFNGMKNPDWVNNHSFYFINNEPASEDSGYYYPVMTSGSWLPH